MHMNLRPVAVNVLVENTVMFVDMGVHNSHSGVAMNWCKPMGDPLRDAGEIKDSKENQHQAYGQFHGEADARRNRQVKYDNGRSYQKDRDGVAYSPQCAD